MSSVLVVDDEDDVRDLIAYRLSRSGHEVTSLANPREALALATHASFDMAVLDWSMPDMDGGELCARLRALPHFGAAPVLVVTAFADSQTRDRALAAGATRFMTKPFSLQTLADTVEALLSPAPPR